MDFELTPEEKAFQKEVREFLDEHCTEKVVAETESMLGEGPYSKELIRKMGARKMLAPRWPEEYGIANLDYKSRRERAEAIISVAHPDFRDELRQAAREMFYP